MLPSYCGGCCSPAASSLSGKERWKFEEEQIRELGGKVGVAKSRDHD